MSARSRTGRTRPETLLAIVAHPDDESVACGGLLARAASTGARAAVLCLTRGELGPGGEAASASGSATGPATASTSGSGRRPGAFTASASVAETRAAELRRATERLGVTECVLREHEDGLLPWLDASVLERDIDEAIRRIQPDVVVTFDRDGLYWHPDHIAVHERVSAVVERMGPSAPALWYVSAPPGAMTELAARIRESGVERGAPLFGVESTDAWGALAPPHSHVLDAGEDAARKLEAILCHRTQVAGSGLDLVDRGVAARALAVEHYRRADVGRAGRTLVDRLCTAATASSPRGA